MCTYIVTETVEGPGGQARPEGAGKGGSTAEVDEGSCC